MTDLVNRLRIKAGMIQMGERIAWGSDSDLMYEAADMIERMMASEEQYTPADMADQGAKQFRAGQAGMYTAEDMCSQAAQGYRDGYAAAKGEACPEGYVMVPVEPTPEWVANLRRIRIGSMESVIEDVLAAAPAVQGEPVEAMQLAFELGGLEDGSYHLEADELERVIKSAMDAALPAPDVSGLIGKLRALVLAGKQLDAEAEECIYDDGAAEVASVDFWGDFRDALEAADAALAAYRKGVEQ